VAIIKIGVSPELFIALRLHSDSAAFRTLPFSFLVVDMAFEFFHGDSAGTAGQMITLASNIPFAEGLAKIAGTRLHLLV